MENRNIEMAQTVAAAVREAGGRTFFVGGYVRDRLLGRETKDVDIEVHGIPVKTLEGILDRLGERLSMGASFGVMGLRHYELDIAMPRSEYATGRGHRDFAVFVDPFLGEEKAAQRRDFTVNAMMQDVLTGEILDFFGGQEDLRRRILRHVDDATFPEDPLRVFRAAQFAARFGFSVAAETTALCASMDVSALPAERVMGELEKALAKAQRPSVFFDCLRRMDQLSVWFPALGALAEIPGAWERAMRTTDHAAALRETAAEPLYFMLAALCAELPDAEGFPAGLTREARLTKYVLNMAALRAEPDALMDTNAPETAFMELFDRSVCPEDLLLLAEAARAEADPARERRLRELLEVYRERMRRPCVTGRDLIEAGVTPGPALGRALERAHALRLEGRSPQEQLEQALACIREEETPMGGDAL